MHALAFCIAYARGHRIESGVYMVIVIHHSWGMGGELGNGTTSKMSLMVA